MLEVRLGRVRNNPPKGFHMSLYGEAKVAGYIDNTTGLLTTEPDAGKQDNGVLFSAQLLMVTPEAAILRWSIQDCFDPGMLLRRWPDCQAQDSPDNAIGAASAWPKFAYWLRLYGESHGWIFNQATPGKFTWRAWLGRQRGLVGFIRERSKRWDPALSGATWFQRLVFNVGALLTIESRTRDPAGTLDTSDRMLLRTMHLTLEGYKMTWRWVRYRFCLNVRRNFPGGWRGLTRTYYHHKIGAEYVHPLTRVRWPREFRLVKK